MSAVVPVREGVAVVGMFQHAGRFYAISLPHETLGSAISMILSHGSNGPFNLMAEVGIEEVRPIDLPPERKLRVVPDEQEGL